MDAPSPDPTLLSWLPLLVIAFVLLWFLKLTRRAGNTNQQIINVSANMYLDKTRYTVLHKVPVSDQEDATLIEHLIVSPFGLFVISTVPGGGLISGSESQDSWTRQSYRQSSAFPNPLPPVRVQAQALAQSLNLDAGLVFPMVVFLGEGQFSSPMPSNVSMGKNYIEYIQSCSEPGLSQQRLSDCLSRIAAF